MPLPVSHSLVGASIMALLLPQTSAKRKWLLLLFGAFLANLPDFDFFLVWGSQMDWGWHRGLTHSISFALAAAGLIFIGKDFLRTRCFLACAAALLSHGILDFLTTKCGGGVELLYPFSDQRLKLGIVGISEFEQGFYFTEVIKAGLIELMIFTPMLLVVLWIRRYFSYSAIKAGD